MNANAPVRRDNWRRRQWWVTYNILPANSVALLVGLIASFSYYSLHVTADEWRRTVNIGIQVHDMSLTPDDIAAAAATATKWQQ